MDGALTMDGRRWCESVLEIKRHFHDKVADMYLEQH